MHAFKKKYPCKGLKERKVKLALSCGIGMVYFLLLSVDCLIYMPFSSSEKEHKVNRFSTERDQ